jgi:hypothetical protein
MGFISEYRLGRSGRAKRGPESIASVLVIELMRNGVWVPAFAETTGR